MTSPLRDAAESATAGVPVVRKLEWRQLTSPREDGPSDLIAEWESDCVIGTYIIKDDGAEWWLHLADLFDVQQVGRSSEPDLLRNVAQADYEQRILSALNPDFLSALDTARAEIERLRTYAETITAVVRAIAPLAGSEAATQVNGAYYADPAFYAHRIAEQRQAAHDGQVAKVKAVRAESALTAAQARIADLEGVLKKVHPLLYLQADRALQSIGFVPRDMQEALDAVDATLSPVKENDRGLR